MNAARASTRRTLSAGLCTAGLVLVSATAGCGTSPGGASYFRPEPVAGDRGVLYVYRAGDARGGPIEIVVNDRPRGSIAKRQYLAVVVSPGEQFVRAQRTTSAVRSVTVAPGESRYVEVRTDGWSDRLRLEVPRTQLARDRIASSTAASDVGDTAQQADQPPLE